MRDPTTKVRGEPNEAEKHQLKSAPSSIFCRHSPTPHRSCEAVAVPRTQRLPKSLQLKARSLESAIEQTQPVPEIETESEGERVEKRQSVRPSAGGRAPLCAAAHRRPGAVSATAARWRSSFQGGGTCTAEGGTGVKHQANLPWAHQKT